MYWGSFVDVPLILAKVGDRKELHAAFKNSAAKKKLDLDKSEFWGQNFTNFLMNSASTGPNHKFGPSREFHQILMN
jgi:hypothetical protein